ncbi:5229_t:CDS:2 [Dentiscutata erythropus]|uniref:5229_t:CDS:1 n=1 Tax=Dentiscutata erythropus TaxID=1348616 RepID=A0A9N8YWK4_9GLOM|nr:5229_t:CDS:2 [Dentiscutata erythropus]
MIRHVAVTIENQIVFIGGSRFISLASPIRSPIRVYNLSDEVFYLNLSSQFSTSSPPYIDLSNTSARMKFGNEKGTAVLGEASGNKVYLIGGFVFFYPPFGNSWSYPVDQKGTPPARRRSTSTVINQKGIIYIFGGRVQVDTGHVAPILLPSGKILYIGGVSQTEPGMDADLIDMNEYANQSIRIQPRLGHTATLTPDNNEIIIIGGNSNMEHPIYFHLLISFF